MAEFFLELFSEEIPARMQQPGAEALARLLGEALAALSPCGVQTFHGPRRIAYAAAVAPGVAASTTSERGPRRTAPEQALAGFLRKHGAAREALREEGEFWVLDRHMPGVDAASLIATALPALLRRMPWPKQMRWGGASRFTWVRPLRRITCLLDGRVVPFALRDGEDDGHGLASSNLTEGHRFLSAGAFAVTGCEDWRAKLRAAHVIVEAAERRALIEAGLAERAASVGAAIVPDPGLLDEVAGLVEYPVVMLGRIEAAHMDLPPEVMQVSMRVNQRYFALTQAGKAAPYFAFVSNVPGSDGGAAIVAGNERVLRARFADARHFWDLDRKVKLESRLPALDAVTFHAKLGSQGARAKRIAALAEQIAGMIGADPAQARRAGLLAKADLTSGMVGEFPELQGVMGGYYARHDDESAEVADAIAQHYQPKGPADAVPQGGVAVSVALADKLDQLAGFFAIGEKPTGSGDPYGLRRAALGVIRIVRERGLRLRLTYPLRQAVLGHHDTSENLLESSSIVSDVLTFILERLLVQLRAEGARHDVVKAVLGASHDALHAMHSDATEDDIVHLLARTEAVTNLLDSKDGPDLLAAYKRANNILRIEDRKDGPHNGSVNAGLLKEDAESELARVLLPIGEKVNIELKQEHFTAAMSALATLRAPLDAFFEHVTVNDTERPDLRLNRLALLHRLRAAMDQVADFSRIEG